MSEKRILITGGAGCLGSNLIERYLPQNHEITVIDNFETGKREVVPDVPGLTVVEGSIANLDLVQDVFRKYKPTHVIHSAAAYKDPKNWSEDVSTNVVGTINIAKVSLDYNIDRLINFQTALCYGLPEQVPIPVDHQTNPFTSYGISKSAGEKYLMNSGLPVISLRLANICGPRLAIGPIPTFYKRLKAEKSCFCSDTIRDFLDMSDFFALIDQLLNTDVSSGVFNVSTGVGSSILDIYKLVAEYLNIDPPDVPIVPPGDDDVAAVVLDPAETERVFGWKAKIDFENTIQRQLDWYEKYGVNDIYSHLSDPTSD